MRWLWSVLLLASASEAQTCQGQLRANCGNVNKNSCTGGNEFYQCNNALFYDCNQCFRNGGSCGVSTTPCYLATINPTRNPTTVSPTVNPTTANPTATPTATPTRNPTTANPTNNPTTAIPTNNPTTANPTVNPTTSNPTAIPTAPPTRNPTTANPTNNPTTAIPTNNPTTANPTATPTSAPTVNPTTDNPTANPSTLNPSSNPTRNPTTFNPSTANPSTNPTTANPTPEFSLNPTSLPTVNPTSAPTAAPTANPSSANPTANPTPKPPAVPEDNPVSSVWFKLYGDIDLLPSNTTDVYVDVLSNLNDGIDPTRIQVYLFDSLSFPKGIVVFVVVTPALDTNDDKTTTFGATEDIKQAVMDRDFKYLIDKDVFPVAPVIGPPIVCPDKSYSYEKVRCPVAPTPAPEDEKSNLGPIVAAGVILSLVLVGGYIYKNKKDSGGSHWQPTAGSHGKNRNKLAYGFGEQEDDIVEMGAANGLPDSDSDTDQDLTLKEYDSSESL